VKKNQQKSTHGLSYKRVYSTTTLSMEIRDRRMQPNTSVGFS